MISIEALESMFDNIRQDAPWNIDGPMLWGYFFKHGADTKLRELVPALEAQGYRLVDICTHTGEADQEGAAYFLHVEKNGNSFSAITARQE